jgi:hypothetical protein
MSIWSGFPGHQPLRVEKVGLDVVLAVHRSLKTFACVRTGSFAPAIRIQTSFSFIFPPRVCDLSLFFLAGLNLFAGYAKNLYLREFVRNRLGKRDNVVIK